MNAWMLLGQGRVSNAYPGRPEISTENLRQSGDCLENGDDYRREDIRAVAAQLLRERK
jgi:hypothetical protein